MRRTQIAPGVFKYGNGEIGVDEDALLSFMGDVEGELDGVGDDEIGDDDIGDDDIGDDDVGDEVGDAASRYARRQRRLARWARKHHVGQPKPKPAPQRAWGATILAGTETLGAAGAASVAITLQHDFKAVDIAMDGSVASAKVTSIFFGDRLIWQSAAGVPASVFSTSGFLRNFLKGQSITAGLQIVVNGSVGAAGDFAVQITGLKPTHC